MQLTEEFIRAPLKRQTVYRYVAGTRATASLAIIK